MLNRVIEESLSRSPEYRQFLLDEQQAEQKTIAAIAESANAELRKTAKTYADLQAPFWRKPVAEIEKFLRSQNATLISGIYWNVLFNTADEDAPITGTPAEAEECLKQFVDTLPGRTGLVLSPSALMKLVCFTRSQLLTGRNPVTPANLDVYLRTLVTHKCFDAATGECSYDASRIQRRPEPVEEREPTLNDLETMDATSDTGKIAARYLADQLYSNEASTIAEAWVNSLETNFGYSPTNSDLDCSVKWFQSNNKSFLDPRSYDAFRLHMIRNGCWTTNLLTTEDIRARAVDRLDINDRDIRPIVFNGSRQALLDLLARKGVTLI